MKREYTEQEALDVSIGEVVEKADIKIPLADGDSRKLFVALGRLILEARDNRLEAKEFCDIFEEWARVCTTDLKEDDLHKRAWRKEFRSHYRFIHTAIKKSNLLSRMLFGGEKPRTKQCPLHKGKWSGFLPDPCPHGCSYGYNVTGWIDE